LINGTGTGATFSNPYSVVLDSHGNLFVSDHSNMVIRKITPAGVVTTFAGSGSVAADRDGTGVHATFNYPFGMVIDNHDNLYVADDLAGSVRKVTSGAVVTTLAAVGSRVFDVGVNSQGILYFPGFNSGIVYKRSSTGAVTNFATGFAGPHGIAVDSNDNVYVTDTNNCRVYKILPDGTKSVFVGSSSDCTVHNGIGSGAGLASPVTLRFDRNNNLYIHGTSQLVQKATPAGVVTTVFGTGTAGYLNGDAAIAQINGYYGRPAFDAVGNAYYADNGNNRIRRITFAPAISSVSPSSGLAAGGTAITITGTYFMSGSTVTVGGNAATVTSINASGTLITAVTPAGSGPADVVVTLPTTQQFGTLTAGFTYPSPSSTPTAAPAPSQPPGGSRGGHLVQPPLLQRDRQASSSSSVSVPSVPPRVPTPGLSASSTTLKERIEARKQERLQFLARIQQRAEQRKARKKARK
jgi:sugar lactone lactonase YvrE